MRVYLECAFPSYGCYFTPSKKQIQGKYTVLSSLLLDTLTPFLLAKKQKNILIVSSSVKEEELLPWLTFLKENLSCTLKFRLINSSKVPKTFQKGWSKAKGLLSPSVKLFRNKKTSKLRLEIGGELASTKLF